MKSVIYLDNAATSWPKPERVYREMDEFLRNWGANPGRAGHRMAVEAGRMILDVRSRLAVFFNAEDVSRVVFTFSATDGINGVLKGLLHPGDEVITTNLEHNSVARPLARLSARGVVWKRIPCDTTGVPDLDALRELVTPRTKMIAVTHSSNVLGTIQPLEEIGALAEKAGCLFVVDAAQTAGSIPIDVQALGIDVLAFSGHKSLYGPPGTGGLILSRRVALPAWREGGTGTASELLEQPTALPEALESGTPNTVGIAGLGAGLAFIEETGPEAIRAKERSLIDQLLSGLSEIPGVTIYGPRNSADRVSLVSFNLEGWDPFELAGALEEGFDIGARPGLHCAPLAHQAAGTFPTGSLRLSPGYFNDPKEIAAAVEGVRALASGAAV